MQGGYTGDTPAFLARPRGWAAGAEVESSFARVLTSPTSSSSHPSSCSNLRPSSGGEDSPANPRASRRRLQRERRKPYSYATLPQDVSHGRGHSRSQRMYNPLVVTVTNFREDGPSSRSLIAYYFLSSSFLSLSFLHALFQPDPVYARRKRKRERERARERRDAPDLADENLAGCKVSRVFDPVRAQSASAGPPSTSF